MTVRPLTAGPVPATRKQANRRIVLKQLCDIAERAPQGAFVEIGVYRGVSAMHLNQLVRRRGSPFYLYDTFEGMPFASPRKGDRHSPGDFSHTSLERVQAAVPNGRLIKGVFPHSLVPMPPVAFLHADADQYESTLAICRLMPGRMVPGGIILFDDYMIPGCRAAVEDAGLKVRPVERGRAVHVVPG